MGFFDRGEQQDAEQAQARARVEEGHIPPRAQARLRALTSDGSLFTSGLSVSEFALLGRMGPQPLAQVMGASVVRPGWQYLPALDPGQAVAATFSSPYAGGGWQPWQGPYTEASPAQVRNYLWHAEVVCELDVVTAAWNLARRRALDRLTEEALEVNADAVVGVRDLSVQDYWRLHAAGQEPVGLVATTTAVFASPPRTARIARVRRTAANIEFDELSTAFRTARETVRARLESQIGDVHGAGAVGVSLRHSVHRHKLAPALSLGSAAHRGWQRGRLGPVLRLRARRYRRARLGHHDARRGHGRAPSPGCAGASRGDPGRAADGDVMNDYDPTSLEGVPESGRERLAQNREGLYTSDLSVNEFLLVSEAGFDPVGLVVGSSIFQIGFQITGPSTSRELDVLSQAMYSARHLAMTRMEEEADQLGADGIVGVRLDIGRYEWGANMAEFIAIGTAVRHREGVLHRAPNGRPFQSDLSGQEFWTLLRTGHRPVGMVMGSCVYHVGRRGPLRTVAQTGRNVELPNFTQALYDARELAMQRMQTEAQELGAEGIVGVSLSEKSHGWGSHVIEFFALGTAIVSTGTGAKIEPPITVLDLNDD